MTKISADFGKARLRREEDKMVDVQEQRIDKRKPNGRTIKSGLLHKLDAKFVTIVCGSEESSGIFKYKPNPSGSVPGFYFAGKLLPRSQVHRVYLYSNRIELYDDSQKQRGLA